MLSISAPSNKKKRLYKMAKHLGNPLERWWMIAPDILNQEQWLERIGRPMNTGNVGMQDDDIPKWVEYLYGRGKEQERAYWLELYRTVYLQLVHRAVQDAISSGFGLKTISSVHVGERNFPVWTDCLIAPCGLLMFLETRKATPVDGGFPKTLRSVFRPAPNVDIPTWCMAAYYQDRSERYAERFEWRLPTDAGWSLGDTTVPINYEKLNSAMIDPNLVGRGLVEFVLGMIEPI